MAKSNLNQINELVNKTFKLPNISGEFKITEQFKSFFLEKCGHDYGTVHQFSEDTITARSMYFGQLVEYHIPFNDIKIQ